MQFTVTPLSDTIGARITGLDLRQPLDEDTARAIREVWLDHCVILIPDQDLTADQQVAFAAAFGELEPPRAAKSQSADEPNVLLITNVEDTGMRTALEEGEMYLHSDGAYYEVPSMATLLYAIEAPAVGGHTILANCYHAYDALPGETKERIAGRTCVNAFELENYNGRMTRLGADTPHFSHPLAITHDETGRKALFVSRMQTISIDGMDDGESNDLLAGLFDHLERPEFTYEHKWTPGDLLMWDNRCTMHGRTDFDPNDRRMLRRLTLKGVRPN